MDLIKLIESLEKYRKRVSELVIDLEGLSVDIGNSIKGVEELRDKQKPDLRKGFFPKNYLSNSNKKKYEDDDGSDLEEGVKSRMKRIAGIK